MLADKLEPLLVRLESRRQAHPVFSGGLKSSKMPCIETRSINFYGYAYASN